MKFNKNQLLSIVGAFLLGGFVTYFVSDYLHLKSQNHITISPIKNIDEDHKINQDRVTHSQSSQKNNDNTVIKDNDRKDRDPFSQMDRMRQQMRKQMDQMMAGSFSNNPFFKSGFDDDLTDSFNGGVQITRDEDDQFKYIRISGEGVDKDTLDIKIKDGMISISGQVEKRSDDGQGSQSTYISKFSQSFNIPSDVKEEEVQVDSDDQGLVLKFKKSVI